MRARALSLVAVVSIFVVTTTAPAALAGSGKSTENAAWWNPFDLVQRQVTDLYLQLTQLTGWLTSYADSFQTQLNDLRAQVAVLGAPAPPPTSAVNNATLFDANGNKVGAIAGFDFAVPMVSLSAEGRTFALKAYPDRLVGSPVFFLEPNCNGTPFVQVQFFDASNPTSAIALAGTGPSATGVLYTVVYATTPHALPTQPIVAVSRFPLPQDGSSQGLCFNFFAPFKVTAALPAVPVMELSAYAKPYVVK